MNKRMARITELYKNPDLIIPQNTVAHYSANTWIAHTPQGEIYFLDFSGTVLTRQRKMKNWNKRRFQMIFMTLI